MEHHDGQPISWDREDLFSHLLPGMLAQFTARLCSRHLVSGFPEVVEWPIQLGRGHGLLVPVSRLTCEAEAITDDVPGGVMLTIRCEVRGLLEGKQYGTTQLAVHEQQLMGVWPERGGAEA